MRPRLIGVLSYIHLERLRKKMKDLNQDNQWPREHLNWSSTKYMSASSLYRHLCLVTIYCC
jgi:hypothetical protein